VVDPFEQVREQIARTAAGDRGEMPGLPETAVQEVRALAASFEALRETLRTREERTRASEVSTRQSLDALVDALADAAELDRKMRALNHELRRHGEHVAKEVARATGELREQTRLNEQLQQEQLEHLRQVDRQKDQFLSILSHELRTPLNAIMGFASILDDEISGPLNEDQHAHLAKIVRGTEVLLALINDLLDMSRIQAGKFSLAPEPMPLDEVCASVIENLHVLAEQKDHKLFCLPVADPRPIMADRQRVSQVLMNLVGNAIKFTPRGGEVSVSCVRERGWVRFEVRDNGLGIEESDQRRLFQRFTQLDGSNTREAGGTGLGLSISKALVEAHGGMIGVESKPGQGANFWFTLPDNQGINGSSA
jgi:signal transduction histidine kinase